ncbi:YybH family protein [Paludisphaera mucosa]|uniref:SgcJ/EcaC family oxidoreductase n=1 Tax=Paludisphaera mucosa TaxID=3030827 RepID=A0ABT6FCJ8_9BACT|nr:SgcJ/EcaC family oxidoreductase [Paludisphaera mucosa]MDG3005317.1 SgcJ/EcaC family oxidoreductase [Paludisphaera mucosa]
MSKSRASLLLLLGTIPFAAGRSLAEEPPAAATGGADRAAIEAVVADFVRAFDAGDAKAVAALFTEAARIETEGSPPVQGRAAIEKLFADRFAAGPGQTIVLKMDSLRMLGADAAIEEGSAAITTPSDLGESAEVTRYKYAAAYVRKDGRWLQDCIHDYPSNDPDADKAPRERLEELAWLIGEWIDEDDDAEVRTTGAWSEDGAFLIRKYRVKIEGEVVMSGVQRIGWDPRQKQFRSWTFDSEGGFSEGLWSREGQAADRWVVKATGVLKDGRAVSATNVLARLGRDVLSWTSVDRTLGGAALPDAEAITLVRKPPAPRSVTTSPKPSEPAGTQP